MTFHGINQAISNPRITLQLSAINPLTGNNFEEWYESFNVHMTLHNLDLALRVDESSKPTDVSSVDERSFYEKLEHSNRSCLMVMKYTMDKSIKECVSKMEMAKDFMEYVKANYTKIDKVEMTTYLKFLTTTMYDGVGGVRDHIIKLKHYFNKANEMKEEWTLEELMSIVVQHEVSLKKNETHSFALVTDQVSNMKKKPPHKNFGGSKQFKRKKNLSQGTSNASVFSNATKNERFKGKCNFCHKIGHKQVDCFKFKNWLEKKKKCEIVVVVNLNANMIETNIVDVHANSWRKMAAKTKKEKVDKCGSTLDLIHTDICDPLTPTALGGYKYFITFIDNFSRYGYVELIHENSNSLNVFKAFKAKVELQLGKPIKVVKSNRGVEYYGRYDEIGRNPGPFAKFLLECDIDVIYTMTATYILNQVPSKSMPKTPYELWSRKKPSLHHFHVWGSKAEVRPYNPQSKKLDPKTISGFFVGYCIRSRGSKFYCPSHTARIIESNSVVYFEDKVNLDPNFVPHVDVPIVQQSAIDQREHGDQVELGIPEHEYDGYDASDPITYQEAIHCPQFTSWKEAMDDEMNSMYMNGVWDLVELPHGCKLVGCKWVFKTKRDSSRQIERYKTKLVAKGYNQRGGIDFKETFSPVSTKDSFRVIMAIVAHFDLELHHMDVKTVFLNGDLDEDMYMEQPTVVAFSKNTKSTSRSKHIDVKFYFVKEKVAESLIDIEHMSTKEHTLGLNLEEEGEELIKLGFSHHHWTELLLNTSGARNGFPWHYSSQRPFTVAAEIAEVQPATSAVRKAMDSTTTLDSKTEPTVQ
ncbi:Retrovirus-related Pol polyprotein from transposon TNT 1-94 [Vitis vinifera]|uniref:Retrovirus-related Pol polyprotein from transposon TNT 1-94 n=1 Tax=Vitis vinifera TaxID=29760 RepID=A0A438K781_VITVI|nr:Retrovirus-related Pol polyprotein from transposon TNT 1-94 [Vitis vinifera]